MNINNKNIIISGEDDLPKKIRLDICNFCQLNCAACGIRSLDKFITNEKYGGFGYVNFETFKNFVDRHSFIEEIELSSRGEIFLNTDIDKILEYAYEKNIKLSAYGGVNLNFLPETTAEALVKYNFQGMNVAIDGATSETYAIYRRRGDFNTVINNVKLINKYKQKYNSKFPHLIYQFILFGHNEHEIEQAKQLANELNMEIYFVVNQDPSYSPLKNKALIKKLIGKDSIEEQTEFHYREYKNKKSNWFFCMDLYESPIINSKGYIQGCCMNLVNNFYGINVFEEGLLKALNDERIIYAKSMINDFSVPPRSDIPCSYCKVYEFLKSNNLKL